MTSGVGPAGGRPGLVLADRLLASIERALNLAAAGGALLLMAAVTIQIIARYIFNRALPGVYESAELLLVGIIYLGLAHIQSRNGHIRVELFVSRLSPAGRNLAESFALLPVLALFAIITYKSGQTAYQAWRMGEVSMGLIDFPVWPAKMMVPIGTSLLCLRFIVQFLRSLSRQPLPTGVRPQRGSSPEQG